VNKLHHGVATVFVVGISTINFIFASNFHIYWLLVGFDIVVAYRGCYSQCVVRNKERKHQKHSMLVIYCDLKLESNVLKRDRTDQF